MKPVRRPGVRAGYDRWSRTYDSTPNPLVALDERITMDRLEPAAGETILDAACGTGRNLGRIVGAGSRAVGLDLSAGMLGVAKERHPRIPLVQANLEDPLPVKRSACDAVLCALVGEHLGQLAPFFREAYDVLRPGGRLVFSVFHPELAQSGIEANFDDAGSEVRLGAEPHSIDDYVQGIEDGGFDGLRVEEYTGDEQLASEVEKGAKYLGRPLLLLLDAHRPGPTTESRA